jgi:hypothetical protein
MSKSVIEFSFMWYFVACKDLASHALCNFRSISRKILNFRDEVMDEGDGQQKQHTGNTVKYIKTKYYMCSAVCICINME